MESCCLADQSNCLYTTPFKNGNCFFYQQQNEILLLLCLFWNIGSKIKVRQKMKKKDWSLLQLKFDGRMNWLFLDLTAIYKWGSEEQRKERVRPGFDWGESANAVPNSHKLCSRVPHIWGNRRLQLHLSAMVESRPEGTALLITVSFEPGKYAWTC